MVTHVCVRARTHARMSALACTRVWLYAWRALAMRKARQGFACMHTCVHVCLRLDACMRESRAPSLGRAHHLGQGRSATVTAAASDAPCPFVSVQMYNPCQLVSRRREVEVCFLRELQGSLGAGVQGTSMYRVSLASQTKAVFGYKPTFSLNQRFLSCPRTSNRGCRYSRRTYTS